MKKININVPVSVSGHVSVQKWSKKRGTWDEWSFDNLVLDVGLQSLRNRFPNHDPLTGNLSFGVMQPRYLWLGTSSVEPQHSDTGLLAISTGLGSKEAGVNPEFGGSTTNRLTGGELYSSVRFQFDYGEGEAAGTWSELGLSFGPTYTEPFNRALFRDGLGAAQQVTVLADEYLRVFVELRMHFPPGMPIATGSFLLNGTTEVLWEAFIADRVAFNLGFTNFWQVGWGERSAHYRGVASTGSFGSGSTNVSGGFHTNTSYSFDALTMSQSGGWSLEKGIASDIKAAGFGTRISAFDGVSPNLVIRFNQTIDKPDTASVDGTWGVTWSLGHYVESP